MWIEPEDGCIFALAKQKRVSWDKGGGWIHKVDHGGATQGEEELLLLNVEIYNAQHVVSRHYLKADYM